ncbi:hypothetical protein Fcan01_19034 [Folsomia candida]|uniref:Uncharacterized protein n=1 Tax=Folsomia candida TaxID=158441 RepID=A0A226DM02_FOLCA|nr:hypothetical protein Fcan01_19034 [Folsomia candida]
MISDLNSIAFSSIPIVTTGREVHSFTYPTKEFTSFLTDEIETRLIVDVNNSNIYNILKNINDRTNFLLSSWYDFAFNVSNKHPIKTHNGYKPNPEIFVLMDEEACKNLGYITGGSTVFLIGGYYIQVAFTPISPTLELICTEHLFTGRRRSRQNLKTMLLD